MLEKYAELKKRHEAKQAARKQVLAELDAEFGDTEAALKEERDKILAFAKDNGFRTLFETNGSFEVRTSAPKYKVKDDLQLILYLAMGHYEALDYKKSVVNALAKEGLLDDLVEVVTEDEIAITVTYPKE